MVGAPGLEKLLHGIFPGDNCVWSIDREAIPFYIPLAEAMIGHAIERGTPAIYFRFGSHQPLCSERPGLLVHRTDPAKGFESFITEIHEIIRANGTGAYYLFDSLSELSRACYSDRMIGNFFMLTCPYLRELETIAYFIIYRNFHSYHATTPITDTVQILIDLYVRGGIHYLTPRKVENRNSPTMYMLHEWNGSEWAPVPESSRVAAVIHTSPWPGLPSTSYRMIGVWDRVFLEAEHVRDEMAAGRCSPERERATLLEMLRLIVSPEQRIFDLVARFFSISDLLAIWKRMIGTGMIGGKSVGMLLARAILGARDPRWNELLEEHDSFFIGSDVFYTFLVANNCWWARQRQKNPDSFLDGNEDVRRRILTGQFPDYILRRFSDLLDYFGYSPIIVRSSSLLEDNFGYAFAGKYESVFCPNQGTKEERMKGFLDAVRVIYASTMSDVALRYRKQRGVLEKDEQMALLVQRVSGIRYERYYFPQLAGVGFSVNPYAWSPEIDPKAGMLRVVFGLGTHAVERSEDDYTRLVALNAPERRPESSADELRRYTQRRVDLLDLEENKFVTLPFASLAAELEGRFPMGLFARRERGEAGAPAPGQTGAEAPLLTFDPLFRSTELIADMRSMLATLREAYGAEVDIEFTANFMPDGRYRINLVQCRPLQMEIEEQPRVALPQVSATDILMDARGAVIGRSRVEAIDWILYVVPELYASLPDGRRYAVARLIGELLHAPRVSGGVVMLIGPGRWGTSTPSLGIPTSFAEINTASILCELNVMHSQLKPDLSLGTHFFNELVEMNMLYIGYDAERGDCRLAAEWLEGAPNLLEEVLAGAADRALDPSAAAPGGSAAVRLIDGRGASGGRRVLLNADSIGQRAVLHLE